MKERHLFTLLSVEAAACVLFCILQRSLSGLFSTLIAFPFEQIGAGLRVLSLSGAVGNVIAIIGDGSLSGGEALEGLNNASVLNSNIIIVVNDNDMSIAENYGGLYKNLAELRNSNGTCENNFFKTMGFDYKYVSDGHDIEALIDAFESVKDTDHPTILHIHTTKGKGCALAEENKEAFHWIMPNMLETFGKSTGEVVEDYNSIGNKLIMEKAKKDKRVIVINPATPIDNELIAP